MNETGLVRFADAKKRENFKHARPSDPLYGLL
jgi:hypothetical protein